MRPIGSRSRLAGIVDRECREGNPERVKWLGPNLFLVSWQALPRQALMREQATYTT
jgi:hypothetical protein